MLFILYLNLLYYRLTCEIYFNFSNCTDNEHFSVHYHQSIIDSSYSSLLFQVNITKSKKNTNKAQPGDEYKIKKL